MARISRRRFLSDSGKCAAGAALGAAALSAASHARAAGANPDAHRDVRLALIGCGGRGRDLARGFITSGAEIVAVCDVQARQMDYAVKDVQKAQKLAPRKIQQIKKLLESKDVQAVIVATPDHWHAPATVLACQAGKDVYVEKPASHNIWGGRKMVEAARKYDRVVQVGTQNRSAPYALAAREYIQSGKLGDIHLVKVYNLKSGGPVRIGQPGKCPEGFDWDGWLGAAPMRPFTPGLVHQWYHFWDFCGGDMGNDSIHQIDLARMLLGDPPAPAGVFGSGGRFHHKDDAEVPDTQVAIFEYPGMILTFENTQYPPYMAKTPFSIRNADLFPYWPQNATRIELYGSKELMIIGRHGGGWQAFVADGKVSQQAYGRFPDPEHQRNFLDCIKSRKRPNADIAIGHDSAVLVHQGNIALRTGNQKLRYDAKAERFIDNDAANKLVKPEYRKGYDIPEEV